MVDRRAAAWRARALGRSLPQRLVVVAWTRDARDVMISCVERAARAAGELELFAVNVAIRDLTFASRAAAVIASERVRATPTTSFASFTSGSERRRPPARSREARAQRAARAACCAARARLRHSLM